MYMFSAQQNGITIYCYKHRISRRYLNLDHDGHAYQFTPGVPEHTGVYQPISLSNAIVHAISLPPIPPEEHNAIMAGLQALRFLIVTDALPPDIRRIHTNGKHMLGINDLDELYKTLTYTRSQTSNPTE